MTKITINADGSQTIEFDDDADAHAKMAAQENIPGPGPASIAPDMSADERNENDFQPVKVDPLASVSEMDDRPHE